MYIQVFMLNVPWQEVVEETEKFKDKDKANDEFKKLVSKYKPKNNLFLRR